MKLFISTCCLVLVALSTFAQPAPHDGDEAGNYPLIVALIMLAGAVAYRLLKNKAAKI